MYSPNIGYERCEFNLQMSINQLVAYLLPRLCFVLSKSCSIRSVLFGFAHHTSFVYCH